MRVELKGLREATRVIEARLGGYASKVEKGLQRELDLIQTMIQVKMKQRGDSSLAPYVKINYEQKTLYLEYNMGTGAKGRKIVSARNYHNPASEKFKYQPFQETLQELGYEDISPAPGQPIEISHGEPPGVRITAKMSDIAIRRILA